MKLTNWKTTVAILALVVTGCGASTQVTAATAANGDTFPFCLEVVQPINPIATRIKVMACATTESELATKEAELKAVYPKAQLRKVAAK